MCPDRRAADLRGTRAATALSQVARVISLVTRRLLVRHSPSRKVRTQVAWGLLYIETRYGGAAEPAPGWYRDGQQP